MSTWFITGTSSGFGRKLTEQLLARGDTVAATLRDPKALDDLASDPRLWRAALDVTDTAAIRRVVARAVDELGRLDVVVSNAGYGCIGAAEALSDAQIERQLATNLLGSMQLIRAVLPHLRAQGGGRILQVSSAGGQVAYPSFSAYHASKWGIEGFVEAVAQEVAPFGIELTIVEPGATHTSFGSTSLDTAPEPAVYAHTPVGELRRAWAAGKFPAPGDATKVATAMIACASQRPAPRRLPLGSDTYADVHAALSRRLAEHEAQRATALAADTK